MVASWDHATRGLVDEDLLLLAVSRTETSIVPSDIFIQDARLDDWRWTLCVTQFRLQRRLTENGIVTRGDS